MISVRDRLGALQEPRFRLLWTAQACSSVGDVMVPVAIVFAVIEISGSASEIGIVLAAQLFTRATLMLVGGVWADRLPRQWVMLTSDLVRGASQSLGAVLLLTGHAQVWHLAVLAAVHGGAAAFFVPASTGLVPDTVSAARLQQANALMVLSRNALGIAGPAISGLLVGAFGAGWVYAIDAVSFAASASFLARLPTVRDEEPRESRRFLADLAAGWRELTARTWLWTSIAYFSVFNVAFASFFVLGPLVCQRDLGGAKAWGLIMAGASVGAVAGSALGLRVHPGRPLVFAYLIISACALEPLLLVPPAPAAVVAVGAALAMTSLTISTTLWVTALQQHVPRQAISRVSAYDWMGSLIFAPVGFALSGPTAGWLGIDATLLLAAGILIGSNLAIVAVPSVRAVRRRPSEPVTPVELLPKVQPM
ncbi:MAG TPA: MFS transporter [Gaiellaceae bacterium]|nr:MFS transporter [Gaiellaceae bacterium]